MDEDTYIGTQVSIGAIESFVAALDINGFLAKIERAHSLGPILDPTLYRSAMGNLQHIEAVARKLRELQALTLLWLDEQQKQRG